MHYKVTIPLLNPNEPEALLAGLRIHEGQQVSQGDILCTLETTKSAADILAERDGYVAGLRYVQGQTVQAGDTLCYLADNPDWQPPVDEKPVDPLAATAPLPDGLRITQPALTLARQRNLDLSKLPIGPLVTENQVRALIGQEYGRVPGEYDPTAVIVYGGGGHGKSLIELLRALRSYRIVGVVDDGLAPGMTILGVPLMGNGDILPALHARGIRLAVNAVGGIGNISVRMVVFERLAQAGFSCPAVVHPVAFIEVSAQLSPAVQVFPFAYVGSNVQVGFGAIINTGAIISHDCILGDYVNISPGAILAGSVEVGHRALVGMGATTNLGIRIGAGARIGNGATVKQDVPDEGVVRAGSVWPD